VIDAAVDGSMVSSTPRWKRVLLKLSGEAFAGDEGFGIDGSVVQRLAKEIVEVRRDLDVDVAIVVGGGNIWRGMEGDKKKEKKNKNIKKKKIKI